MLTALLDTKTGKARPVPQPRPGVDPAELLEKHAEYLFRFAFVRVRDKSIAEDLVQETLLAALKNMNGFYYKSSERTWLTAILKNKIIDHFRRSKRETAMDLTADEDFFGADGRWKPEYSPTDWNASPLDMVENQEFWQIVNRCLAMLPRRTAAAFVLREIEGLSSEEICQTLDISPNNLWVMLHRARLLLRREIELNFLASKNS